VDLHVDEPEYRLLEYSGTQRCRRIATVSSGSLAIPHPARSNLPVTASWDAQVAQQLAIPASSLLWFHRGDCYDLFASTCMVSLLVSDIPCYRYRGVGMY
jgi:hypothetical protein